MTEKLPYLHVLTPANRSASEEQKEYPSVAIISERSNLHVSTRLLHDRGMPEPPLPSVAQARPPVVDQSTGALPSPSTVGPVTEER